MTEPWTVARASGSAEEESHALTTLGILEHRRDAVDTARSLLCAARRRAAAVGSRVLELRALCNLSSLELDAGNLAKARAVAVDAAELAERAGLSSSVYGIEARLVGSIAHYQAGDWDAAERLTIRVDDRRPTAGPVSAVSLFVEVGRGRRTAEERIARRAEQRGNDPWLAFQAGGCEADLACWQGDLDRARAVIRTTLEVHRAAGWRWRLNMTWPAALGMAAEANRAERAGTAGDQAAWVRNQDPEADSGVILLPHSMPAGYGNFSYEARSDAQLTSQLVNVDGYPADKSPYSQLCSILCWSHS
jgi:hypothetical protein